MSIYQTLYYKKRKQEDPEFAEKMRVLPRLICILFTYWLPKCNRNIVCYELFTKQWCIYLNGFGSRNVLVLIPHVFVVISRSSRCGCHLGLVAVGFLPLRCLGLSLSLVFFPFSVFSLSFPLSCCGGLLQLRAFIAKKEPWPSYAAR